MTVEVSKIFLREVATGAAVEAELRDAIEEAHLADWQDLWRPAKIEKLRALQAAGIPVSQWPQSWHWNWPAKLASVVDLLSFRGFSVSCRGETQGLMRIDLNMAARIPSQKGKPLVYVQYLEAAPWNQPEFAPVPRFRGVGKALVAAALSLSLEEDFKGRVGLHSLPQADRFYQRCNMTDLGPDAACKGLRYFETTPEQAESFLKGSGR